MGRTERQINDTMVIKIYTLFAVAWQTLHVIDTSKVCLEVRS